MRPIKRARVIPKEYGDEVESSSESEQVSSEEEIDSDGIDNSEDEEDGSEDNGADDSKMSNDDDEDDTDGEEYDSDNEEVESNSEDDNDKTDELEEDYMNESNEEDGEEISEEDDSMSEGPEEDAQSQIQKGEGIIAQSMIYNSMLSCRMKTQEAITAMNQLPQGENYECVASTGAEIEQTITHTKHVIEETLYSLLKLQDCLLSSRSDTTFITKQKWSDGEETEHKKDAEVTGKRKIDDCPQFLAKRQKLLNKYRDETLETIGKVVSTLPIRNSFANFESSTLAHINQVLLDKERLVKRTQLVRSALPVIGKKEDDDNIEEDVTKNSSRKHKYNVETFDDSDFFNKLLTQHVSLKTAQMTDMSAVGKEWAELNKLKKSNALVDRKASKGRKTRYTVHRKLVNFMTPVDSEQLYSDEQRDALAREIFRG